MPIDIISWIDFAGVAAFSISGVFAAMHNKLDIFGVLIIAFVTALGGGTLRDILIGELPVTWMFNLNYGLVVLISAVITILFKNYIQNYRTTLLLFDSLGLGLFTILGLQKGLALDLHPAICVLLGTVTASFGGVIRDILLNNIPVIFHKEIYATACILGGVLFFLLSKTSLNTEWLYVICIAVVVLTRIMAVRFNLRLPSIYRKINS